MGIDFECLGLVRDKDDPRRVHIIYADTGVVKKSGTYHLTCNDPYWPWEIKWDDSEG